MRAEATIKFRRRNLAIKGSFLVFFWVVYGGNRARSSYPSSSSPAPPEPAKALSSPIYVSYSLNISS